MTPADVYRVLNHISRESRAQWDFSSNLIVLLVQI